MIWATLIFGITLFGIIILSMILDEIGFFEYAALWMAHRSRGKGTLMFVYLLLLGAIVATLFANDGAALILTPIILAKMKHLKFSPTAMFAFLMAGGFIGDSASNLLIISNLTNIVTANYFHIGFWEYVQAMFVPNSVSVIISIVLLWWVFRHDIPTSIEITTLPAPHSVLTHPRMFYLSWPFLGILMGGYFWADRYDLPISLFALGGALIFWMIATYEGAIRPIAILRAAPWQIVWLSIGLYVVVYGLKNGGLTDLITPMIQYGMRLGEGYAIMITGIISAILSAVMNNMPTIMIMDLAIEPIGNTALAYANIIGSNLGPKMTPIGSLATLLWLHLLERKGVHIGWWDYMRIGLVITPAVLITTLMALVWTQG